MSLSLIVLLCLTFFNVSVRPCLESCPDPSQFLVRPCLEFCPDPSQFIVRPCLESCPSLSQFNVRPRLKSCPCPSPSQFYVRPSPKSFTEQSRRNFFFTMSDTESKTKSSYTPSMACPPMSFKGDLEVNWRNWYQQFNVFMLAANLTQESDSRKNALLLHHMGKSAFPIYTSFNLEITTAKFDDLVKKFKEHFSPKVNVTVERLTLFNRKQGDNETLEDFVTSLKNLSLSCQLGDVKDSITKDLFIGGLNSSNQSIKEKLLLEEKTTLQEVYEIALKLQLSKSRSNQITQPEVNVVKNQTSYQSRPKNSRRYHQSSYRKSHRSSSRPSKSNHSTRPRSPSSNRRQQPQDSDPSSSRQSRSREYKLKKPCPACGNLTHIIQCPALGVKCRSCGGLNHFSRFCPSRNVNFIDQVSDDNQSSSESDCEPNDDNAELFVGTLHCLNVDSENPNDCSDSKWYVPVSINRTNFKAQVDTGAQTNIISVHRLRTCNVKRKIRPTHNIVKTLSGQRLNVVGECHLILRFLNKPHLVKFHVVDFKCETLLGFKLAKQLNLIQTVFNLNEDVNVTLDDFSKFPPIVQEYKDLFQGIGCVQDHEVHLETDPNVKPVIDPPRKVPMKLIDDLEKHINKLVSLNIIEKVDHYTDWVNSMVLVRKKDKNLRICLDPRNLNTAIKRPRHSIPNINYVRAQLSGSKYFTTLDASSGFWNLKLDESSSNLCTFNTPFGRFKFLRLPFGVNAASEIFQNVMIEKFKDIPNLIIYIDDFLIHAKTKEEHDETLLKVFQRAREIGIKFNLPKCQFCQPKCRFLGEIYSENSVCIDPERISAIKQMDPPQDVKELQRFFGIVNYVRSFLPNLSAQTENLRKLLKKETLWQWTEIHDKEYELVKSLITQNPVLAHYDVNLPVTLSVDSSRDALGAVILQCKRPVAYASTTLTKSQQSWGQIEKELLAIYFGCSKYNEYCFGQKILIESDHKPLETLFKRSFKDIPIRLQRLMLKLERYDITVKYVPGKQLKIADALSRAPLKDRILDSKSIQSDLEAQIALLDTEISMSISDLKLEEIKNETLNDETLSVVKNYYFNGWPETKKKVALCAQPYFHLREQIFVKDDILFKNKCVIIPHKMRKSMLILIHEGHQGFNRSLARAKNVLFWPFMASDIKNICDNCDICIKYANNNPKQPLKSHTPAASLPWEKLGIDLFDFNRSKYLLVVDYFSKYPEVLSLKYSSNSNTVIDRLKSIFARLGIPLSIISDNGPPFNSQEFAKFCKDWNINHVTSSPNYPRSNGFIERNVQTIKKMMKKCLEDKTDFYSALLNYRNTAKGDLPSPSQLLMSRSLRTKLPCTKQSLEPKICDFQNYKKLILEKEAKSKENYDKHAKPLSALENGQHVYFKKSLADQWTPATVVEICKEPQSYVLKAENNKLYRRNRQHILSRKNQVPTVNENLHETGDFQNCHDDHNDNFQMDFPLKSSHEIPSQPVSDFPVTSNQPGTSKELNTSSNEIENLIDSPTSENSCEEIFSTPLVEKNSNATPKLPNKELESSSAGRGLFRRRNVKPPNRYSPS